MKRIMHNVLKTAVVSALVLSATAGYAQKKQYPYVQDGKIVVCREGSDGVKSSLIHANWSSTQTGQENDANHNRVAAKFEVATSDASTSANWTTATRTCPSGWRLPTIRELRLIYALRNELTAANLPSSLKRWAASVYSSNSDYAWYVDFNDGDTNVYKKVYVTNVRCVRDL